MAKMKNAEVSTTIKIINSIDISIASKIDSGSINIIEPRNKEITPPIVKAP